MFDVFFALLIISFLALTLSLVFLFVYLFHFVSQILFVYGLSFCYCSVEMCVGVWVEGVLKDREFYRREGVEVLAARWEAKANWTIFFR